jgi:hypothetical protein
MGVPQSTAHNGTSCKQGQDCLQSGPLFTQLLGSQELLRVNADRQSDLSKLKLTGHL